MGNSLLFGTNPCYARANSLFAENGKTSQASEFTDELRASVASQGLFLGNFPVFSLISREFPPVAV
jgi:hypothetical protein